MHGSWFALGAMLLVMGVALAAVTVWFMALLLLKPPRMTDGKAAWVLKRLSPGDLQLSFEEVAFDVRDERSGDRLKIAGWWMPHPAAAGRCVVLIHGYADAKVGVIAWAPLFHALGCNLLAIDLRAHGESGGVYSTAGYFERQDLAQVLNQLRAGRGAQAAEVALYGASLGAAVAVAVAADRDDLAGIILECPFPDYSVPAAVHATILGAPGRWFQKWAYALAQSISGADFTSVRPVDLLTRVTCPVMIIQSGNDLLLSEDDAAAVEAAARLRPIEAGALVTWRVLGAHHLAAIYQEPSEYEHRVAGFLSTAFARLPDAV